MPSFVLDASIALAWCFSDESTPDTWALLERLANESAIVPELWHLEVGNVLINAERKNRITQAKTTEFMELMQSLSIEIDTETSRRAGHDILLLARTHKLSTYDAAYLELAMRLGLPLATKDKALSNASLEAGINILNV